MKELFKHTTQTGIPHRLLVVMLAGLLIAVLVSGCSAVSGITGSDEGNPLPTPIPGEDVGARAQSAAKDTPEGTWESYVRDIIAEQVKQRESLIALRERYQNPDITSQNLAGMVQDIDLVTDRTEWNTSGGTASANADFDVRITFTNGDTDTRTCRLTVQMEFDEEDNAWYVLNPEPLAVFAVCP